MATFFFPPVGAGGATAANQTTEISLLTSIEGNTSLTVVSQNDTPLLNTATTNIPASSSTPVEIVFTAVADVKRIISVEDIGEFIGLYSGASLTTLECILPLGGGEVPIIIPAGTRLGLRNMKNAVINSGFIAINYLG